MPSNSVFTVFIPAYYRPELVRQSIQSVLSQTHRNLELILVDNGALPDVKECLNEARDSDVRVRIIRFEENQFSFDDPMLQIYVCWNAALQAATGEYILHLSHDDMLSPNYLEKMIVLFDENPSCTSAASLPVGINLDGSFHASSFKKGNSRPRYIEGHVLALDHLRGGTMFQAPGDIFTFRRETLIAAGGYHRNLEDSQLYGIVPFGESGFDSTAHKLWRYHDNQLNKQLAKQGFVFVGQTARLIKDWSLEERWQVFGEDTSQEVVSTLRYREVDVAARIFSINLSKFRFKSCMKTMRFAWKYPRFWTLIPSSIWHLRRHFASNSLKVLGLRDFVRRLVGKPQVIKH